MTSTLPTEPVNGRINPPVKREITPTMVELLQATKPWVLFCAVLGFICTGFLGLGAVVMVGLTVFAGVVGLGETEPMELAMVGLAVLYIVLAVPYYFGSLFLLRYSTAIGRLGTDGDSHAMEDALLNQKSFWKLVGIMMITMFVVYGVAMAGVAIAGIS
jgi:hypothetical protein